MKLGVPAVKFLHQAHFWGKRFVYFTGCIRSEGFENQKNDILHLWFVFQNYTCSFLSVRKMTTANCLFLLRSRQLDEACLKFFPKLCSTFSLGRNWKGEFVVTPSLRLKHWRNVVSMTITNKCEDDHRRWRRSLCSWKKKARKNSGLPGSEPWIGTGIALCDTGAAL